MSSYRTMELCVLACVVEFIKKYLRTRTMIAQEIIGLDPTGLHSCALGGKLKEEKSARKISSFANFNNQVVVYACTSNSGCNYFFKSILLKLKCIYLTHHPS